MKKVLLALAVSMVSFSAVAGWTECKPFLNQFGVWALNCEDKPGEPPEGYGPVRTPYRDGDVTQVERHADGSVTVHRYGREGEVEEWRENNPGNWSRVR